MFKNRRVFNVAGTLACVGLLAYALYAEYQLGLEPCPLCIFQRVTVALMAVAFLLAALHNPRGWGRYVYAALIGAASLATIGVASRHVWIQAQPPGTVPACGAPLESMLEMFPVGEVVRKVLTGGGECAEISWSFLGLSMPMWVLISAAVLGLVGIFANVRRPG
jgi:protein dithiol:quinone oxidoreductase